MDPKDQTLVGGRPQMTESIPTSQQNTFPESGPTPKPIVGPTNPQPTVNTSLPPTPAPTMMQSSPLDQPPPPPPVGTQIQEPSTDLKDVITPSKPRGKFPLITILVILIILVLGGVGYLAYSNSQLKNKTEVAPTNNEVSLLPTPTPDPYANFKTYTSKIIPIEVMIPNDWSVEETENVELGNQKMVSAKSLDFAYQGASISAGFEFRVGPISDLTKKYNTFEEFTAEENKDGLSDLVIFNNIKFLKQGTTAKTLIDKTPVTIALYTSPDNTNDAIIMFNKILTTFKILESSETTPTPASPSATPAV
jgi:hypothetical protein